MAWGCPDVRHRIEADATSRFNPPVRSLQPASVGTQVDDNCGPVRSRRRWKMNPSGAGADLSDSPDMPGGSRRGSRFVVAVAWVVVVAIGGTDVPGVIVPRPATIDPVRACSVSTVIGIRQRIGQLFNRSLQGPASNSISSYF